MEKSEFVYTTYINTTPELLWKALTEPLFTERYWGTVLSTDWKVGSTMTWEYAGLTTADREQVVLVADRYRRLSYTWHTFTQEFAETADFSHDYFSRVAREPRSKVTFTIEPTGSAVSLTLVHQGFEPGSETLESISEGWPMVLSNLKTLLETDEVLTLS